MFGLSSHFTYLINSPTEAHLSNYHISLWKKVFFLHFFSITFKAGHCCEGSPKTIRTRLLIGKLGFGGFSKKNMNKTFYFYTKKKILHNYFILSFGPRVYFRGQKLTLCRNKKVFYTECPLVKLSYFTLEKSFFFNFNQFFSNNIKAGHCCEGSPKIIKTRSLIRKLGFGVFSKKIKNKTFYF
jgi:hypothetical protein